MKVLFITWFSALFFLANGDEKKGKFYAESDPLPILRFARLHSKSSPYTNPGFPVDNPPTKTIVLSNGDNMLAPLGNRYGELDQNGPVWSASDDATSNVENQRPISRIFNVNAVDNVIDKSAKTPITSDGKKIPNSCVWAIISCCSAASNSINYNCFEQLGCVGSFWESSPCEGEFAQAAISNAMSYYQA